MVLLVIPTVFSLITPVKTVESLSNLNTSSTSAYVSPVLMSDEFWKYGAYVEDPAFLSFESPMSSEAEFHVVNEDVEVGRVIIVLEKSLSPTVLKGKIEGLLGVLPTHAYNVVFATISRDDLRELASTQGVLAVLPDIRIDALANKEIQSLKDYEEVLQESDY